MKFTFPKVEEVAKKNPDVRRSPATLISEEAQDLILGYMYDLGDTIGPFSFPRVCLAWHEAGQRWFYRQPLERRTCEWNWSGANNLRRTLTTRPKLASYVRNLLDLPATVDVIIAESVHRQQVLANGWALEVIRACPQLTHVALPDYHVSTSGNGLTSFARKVGDALENLERDLSMLVLGSPINYGYSDSPDWLPKLCARLTNQGWKRKVDELVVPSLSFVGGLQGELLDHPPLGPQLHQLFEPRRLILDQVYASDEAGLEEVAGYIEGLQITTFSISFRVRGNPASFLNRLPSILPSSLTHLLIDANHGNHRRSWELDDYPFDFDPWSDLPSIPSSLFTSFPSLSFIQLENFRDMTPSTLEPLSQLSNLRRLHLRNSVWLPEEILDQTEDQVTFSPLVALFAKPGFAKIEQLHLGVLPIWDKEPPPVMLTALMKERGWKGEWQACVIDG
ncbi:hypothetical protein T439DRAFT_381792 [Meredithblackwellia eburnea MCA 4105]